MYDLVRESCFIRFLFYLMEEQSRLFSNFIDTNSTVIILINIESIESIMTVLCRGGTCTSSRSRLIQLSVIEYRHGL